MTDQINMFDGDSKEAPKENEEQQNSGDPTDSSTNPFADKLKEIVNENGEPKYKDLESALEALKHSQEFIPKVIGEKKTIEGQLEELRQELEKRESVEEVVQKLLGKEPQHQKVEGETRQGETGLDENKVKEMLNNMLDQRTNSQKEDANLNTVVQQLTEKYGEQAKEVITSRAKELGTTPTELEKIARQNPNMALTLLGGVEIKSQAPSKQTQNSNRTPPSKELPKSDKKLITGGASSKEIMDEWASIRNATYEKYGVER